MKQFINNHTYTQKSFYFVWFSFILNIENMEETTKMGTTILLAFHECKCNCSEILENICKPMAMLLGIINDCIALHKHTILVEYFNLQNKNQYFSCFRFKNMNVSPFSTSTTSCQSQLMTFFFLFVFGNASTSIK